MKHIKSDEEYHQTLKQFNTLFSSPKIINEEIRIEAVILANLLEEYERFRYPELPFVGSYHNLSMAAYGVALAKALLLGAVIVGPVYLAIIEGAAFLLAAIIATGFTLFFARGFHSKEMSGYARDNLLLLFQAEASRGEEKKTS
jgi:hypothetical protein